MRSPKRLVLIVSVFALYLTLGITPGAAQEGRQPLPPLPNPAIIERIITTTGGPTFTSLRVPEVALENLQRTAAGSELAQRLDVGRAVSYIGMNASLSRTITPLRDAASAALRPDTETADDRRPAQVIGTLYEPQRGTVVLVAVWEAPGRPQPASLRFYTPENQLLPESAENELILRKLRGDRTGKPAPGDQGVLISARETCFTIGLDQVCYAPETFTPNPEAVERAAQALRELTAAYLFEVEFDLEGALPDVIGSVTRERCANTLTRTRETRAVPLADCGPNLIFTATTRIVDGQPIGLFRVLRDADLRAFTVDGRPARSLPAGSYLVLDATPRAARALPGSPGVLFLVNANGRDHYLIPSQVVEGFGQAEDPDADARRGQAAIKDGVISGQGF